MSTSNASPAVAAAPDPNGWCPHPPEERQHVFAAARTPLPDRLLCGLCGELLFVPWRARVSG
ncbi:MAG: hypothetical protein ACM3S1_02780 [Hyphomicrobiales bacterium]